jgi:CRP/FNR family transcriptional regulator, cyclic AMP receptor protein
VERDICHCLIRCLKCILLIMQKRNIFEISIFQGMTPGQQKLLLPLVTMCRFPAGHSVFKQGDPATRLYVLESGLVDIVYKPNDGSELLVASLGSGGVFGWSSTLGREIYTSAAYTVTECSAFTLLGKELKGLCVKYPETGVVILNRLAMTIARRVEVTHAEVMNVLNQGMDLNLDL